MPLLAGLAPLIIGLLAAILAIAAALITRALASKLPNLSILGVGLNLANIVRSIGNDVTNWCVDHFNQYFDALADWFTGHILVHLQFFGAVVSAVGHLGDQIAHIVNTSIPNAIRAAESHAGAEASRLFHTAETDIGNVAGRVDTLVTHTIPNAISTAENYTDNAIGDLHRTIDRAIADAKSAVEGELNTAKTDLSRSIASLANTVAADYSSALSIAQSDATAALNTAKGLINQAKAEAESVAQADATRVQNLLQAAINATNATVSKLTGTVASDFTAAEQYAQQQVAAGVTQVTDQLNATAATLQGAINAGAAAAAAGIATDLGAAQKDATDALNNADQAIGGALGAIYGDLTGKSLAYNGDLTKAGDAVGLAITGAIAGVVTRVAKLEKCSVGVCEDSPNNFSNLLKDALGIASVVGVGGFLTELIDNPAQAEQEYANVIAGTVSTGQTLFDQLLAL